MPRPKKASKKFGAASAASGDEDATGARKVSFAVEAKADRHDDTDDHSPSDESEDEDAVLLTGKVESKIFETLLDIRNKNPAIYNPDHKVFHDSDFEIESDDEGSAATKPVKQLRYKDMVSKALLQDGAEALESDPDEEGYEDPKAHRKGTGKRAPTYQEEQDDLKKAFLSAAEDMEGGSEFFKKSGDIDALPEKRASMRGAAAKLAGESDEGLVSRYWAADHEMDEDEQFLRDYILNQRWREDKAVHIDYARRLRLDREDEEHLDEADAFEHRYNYRFEEEGGAAIVGHPRTIEDSLRKDDDRRKKKRQEKRQQQLEEKVRRDEELKRLKSLKKSEIEKRLREIEARAGVQLGDNVVDLNAPFDPAQHERDMARILGIGYHQGEDDEWNPAEDCAEDDPDLWWLCDHCHKGIPAGAKHFDCTECDNYSLCESCVPLANHEHVRMVARVVPAACAPPIEGRESVDKMLDDYYKLDYEDVIGDLKVRFKYRQVQPYKCDLQTVLEKSDKELNAMMPLNRLLAYDAELPKATPTKKQIGKRQKALGDTGPGQSMGIVDRRMTKYNVNRDRLQAFGLKDEGGPRKPAKLQKPAKLSKLQKPAKLTKLQKPGTVAVKNGAV